MWGKSVGGHFVSKVIELEVCGTAEVKLKNDVYKEVVVYMKYAESDIEFNGNRYFSYDMTYLHTIFESQSKNNCPIREFEIYDSDGTTLLPNTNITYVTNDQQTPFAPKIVHITPMVEDFKKVVYLRNKDINPTGQCNW